MMEIVPQSMDESVTVNAVQRSADYIYNVNWDLKNYYYLADSFDVQLPIKEVLDMLYSSLYNEQLILF